MRLTVSHKILLLAVGATLSTGVVVATLSGYRAKVTIESMSKAKLDALVSARQNTLRGYLDSIKQDVEAISANDMTLQALDDYNEAWKTLQPGSERQTLQQLYIQDNPNPAGQKEKLDAASDGSQYSVTHAHYHPWFRSFLQKRGYYDVFLINKQGNVVYTVFKELDFASNVINGSGKSTDLGAVYARAVAHPSESQFIDFKPYAISADAPAAFIAHAITGTDGKVAGVLVFQMPVGKTNDIMQQSAGLGDTGKTYIVGADLLMRSDSRLSKEPTLLKQKVDTASVKAALAGGHDVIHINDYLNAPVFSAYMPIEFLGVTYAMIAEQDESEVMKPLHDLLVQVALFALAIIVAITGIGYVMARGITIPLNGILRQIGLLEKGDKAFEVGYKGRPDEIGDLARALESFKLTAIDQDRLNAEQQKEQQNKESRQNRVDQLVADFDSSATQAVATVASASTELSQTAQEMTQVAKETSMQSVKVAGASEETSNNVQSVASAAEEMSSTIQEISKQISVSSEMVGRAMNKATEADSASKQLVETSNTIGGVADLIEKIASQINLLALNATIESARAGDAGKGFAVVASEVKNLASQATKATEQIRQQLNGMQSVSHNVAQVLIEVKTSIEKISEVSTAVAAAVEEQSAATNEIVKNMVTASRGVEQISANIGGIRTSADATASSTQQVLSAANLLSEQAEKLDSDVKNFLNNIRMA